MSIKNKMKDFFGLEEDPNSTYEEEEYTVANAAAPSTTETSVVRQDDRPKSANNLVALNTKKKDRSKVVLAEPRVFAEAQDISDHLKENRAVIVNLQRMSKNNRVKSSTSSQVSYTLSRDR